MFTNLQKFNKKVLWNPLTRKDSKFTKIISPILPLKSHVKEKDIKYRIILKPVHLSLSFSLPPGIHISAAVCFSCVLGLQHSADQCRRAGIGQLFRNDTCQSNHSKRNTMCIMIDYKCCKILQMLQNIAAISSVAASCYNRTREPVPDIAGMRPESEQHQPLPRQQISHQVFSREQ